MRFIKYSVVLHLIFGVCWCDFYVENFTSNPNSASSWLELSDTLMERGRSKAVLVPHMTDHFKRAVLFTLLDPQPCGAAIAGVKKIVNMDLTEYNEVQLRVKGRGQYTGYEFVLRHKGDYGTQVPSYVHFFEVTEEFGTVTLPISEFKAFMQGKPVENAEPLDRANITSLGIVGYGGVHIGRKQNGVAALDIEWIKII